MVLYYYLHGTNKLQESFVTETLSELHDYLGSPELNIDINIRELPESVAIQVTNILNKSNQDIWLLINEVYLLRKSRGTGSEYSGSDLLIICADPNGKIARMCKTEAIYARYGALFSDTNIAAIYYYEDSYSMWHEVFHLLGAKDCYDIDHHGNVINRGPNCGKTNCIMQYEITDKLIGKWPFICGINIKRIRKKCFTSPWVIIDDSLLLNNDRL